MKLEQLPENNPIKARDILSPTVRILVGGQDVHVERAKYLTHLAADGFVPTGLKRVDQKEFEDIFALGEGAIFVRCSYDRVGKEDYLDDRVAVLMSILEKGSYVTGLAPEMDPTQYAFVQSEIVPRKFNYDDDDPALLDYIDQALFLPEDRKTIQGLQQYIFETYSEVLGFDQLQDIIPAGVVVTAYKIMKIYEKSEMITANFDAMRVDV